MTASDRHPLDDLADNPIAQGAFLLGVMTQLKQAGWSFPMVEGFFDSIIPAEDFLRKEAELMPKIADNAAIAGAESALLNTLPRAGVGLQKLVGSWWPSSLGGDSWRKSMDEQWNGINELSGAANNRFLAHMGKDDVAAAMPEGQRIDYLKNMEDRNFAEQSGARGAEAARIGYGASQIYPGQTDQAIAAVKRVQDGQTTGAEELGNAAAPIIKERLGGNNLPVSQADIADLVSGKQNVGGFLGNNWDRLLADQVKQRLGWDVDPGTLRNWLPGVGIGLAGTLGSRMLGADWTTALGLGLGGGLLGGNVYQASQAGRTLGQQASHVGNYLSGLSKQYVQPLFSPSQTPDQNAAIQNPTQPGAPGAAAPVQPAAAPQTNAAAPQVNQPGAPTTVQASAPAQQTAQNTQQQAQQAGQAAAAVQPPPAPQVSPAAPTTPVTPIK